ncbi:MAG: Gfo/Idh/MocA family oxidoreductase, partial [Cyanobacteria bacterium MAG IRC1_bin_28]|nr:Gfo/Idh/MocA family oxidoreductase [Cyanobacteria bacterium MAG IRC1_bin_28]
GALGVHAFDLLSWLFGPVASVQARLSTAVTARPDPASGWLRNCDAEDVTLIQLTFARGMSAQVNLSSVTRNGRGMWLELYGSDAQVVVGSSNQKDYVHGFTLQVARHGGPLETQVEESVHGFARTWPDGRIAPVARLLDGWATAVGEGRPMIPGLAEGLASQVVADAVQKASATGMAVEVT